MRIATTAGGLMVLAVVLCGAAGAAEAKALPVTVVYKDGGEPVKLKSLELGSNEKGLFGTTFTSLKKIPLKTAKLRLGVPIKNLSKIEILSVTKTGKGDKERQVVRVRLTSTMNKEPLEGVIDSESSIVWKGIHPFADSEAKLDPAKIKEILLQPAEKK